MNKTNAVLCSESVCSNKSVWIEQTLIHSIFYHFRDHLLTRLPDLRKSADTLTEIRLNDNKLTVIHSRYLKPLLKLELLVLFRIHTLVSLPWFPINDLPKLRYLNIGRPYIRGFDCDCSMMWITNTTINPVVVKPFCDTPANMSGKQFENITEADFAYCTGRRQLAQTNNINTFWSFRYIWTYKYYMCNC